MGNRVGIKWSLFEYSTSSWCLQCLGVMRSKGWQMVQLYPYKNGICSRLPRQGLCLPYMQQQKNRVSIHAWCWHENKKSESWPQSWYTESRRLMRWCLYLEANDEEQTTVNDLIVNIKTYLWLVMMIMTHRGNIYMKSELNENFGEEMFITELNGEMNVVTFCYIAASIVFLQCYSSTINKSTV